MKTRTAIRLDRTRVGKIARLPLALRTEINRRLLDGEPASRLLPWLNSQPSVLALLSAHFACPPINPQNLSDWRRGGYRDWLLDRQTADLATRLASDPNLPALSSEILTSWLTAHFAQIGRQQASTPHDETAWRRLRELCADVVALRRLELRTRRQDLQNQA